MVEKSENLKLYLLWTRVYNATYVWIPECACPDGSSITTRLHFCEAIFLHACILYPQINLGVLQLLYSKIPGSPTQSRKEQIREAPLYNTKCSGGRLRRHQRYAPTMFQGFFIIQGNQFTLTDIPPPPQPQKAWICHWSFS